MGTFIISQSIYRYIMRVLSDDRGVSEVLGAILVFALVLLLLVIIQAQAVPAANGQVEFEHNQRVQGDFQLLAGSIDQTAQSGATGTMNVETGVRYPTRFFLINPGPVAGTLRTEPAAFGIENAVATNPEVADYWDGREMRYDDSRSLVYEPDYNQYTNAPTTVYENGIVYNRFESATLLATGTDAINGRRISLVALAGTRSEASPSSVVVETRPVSAPSQTVSVTNAPGERLRLTLRSDLPRSAWEKLVGNETHVESVSCEAADPCGNVTITLEQGVTYDLKLAKVGIASDATEEPAAYLTKVGVNPQLTQSGRSDFTVEMRDRYNTGESGEQVTFRLVSGTGGFVTETGTAQQVTVTTDEQGRATASFRPTTNESVTVYAERDLNGDSTIQDHERVVFSGLLVDAGRGGDQFEINPNQPGAVAQERADLVNCQSADTNNQVEVYDSDCRVDVTFRNLDDTEKVVDLVRVNFYNADQAFKPKGQSPFTRRPNPDEVKLGNARVPIGGGFADPGSLATLQPAGQSGDRQTYGMEFYKTDPNTGESRRYNVVQGDYYVMTLVFEDGTTGTYFVGPTGGETAPQQDISFASGVASGPTASDDTGVEFSLSNTAGQQVRIDAVTVDSVSGQTVNRIQEQRPGSGQWNAELFVQMVGADASVDAGDSANDDFGVGERMAISGGLTLGDGGTAFVSLYQFKQGNTARSMAGTTLTVTVEYTVGGVQRTATGTVPVS